MNKFGIFLGYMLLVNFSMVHAEDISLCKKAWQYKVSSSYDKALKGFNECIEKGNLSEASLARTYRNIGMVYHAKKENKKAIEYYTKAIALKPKDVENDYINRANAWDDEANYEKALLDYNKSLSIVPNNPNTYYNRGIVYRRVGKIAEAIKNYDKAEKYGYTDKRSLLKEQEYMKEIESRNAAVGYVSTVRMFIEATALHCQSKLGKDKQWVKKQINLWEKNNTQYLNAAKKWIRYYYNHIQNYNKKAGEALMKKNYLTIVKNAKYMATTALSRGGGKTPAENCEIYVEYLHNGAYDITKKIKMYDELENLVHSKKQPLDGL